MAKRRKTPDAEDIGRGCLQLFGGLLLAYIAFQVVGTLLVLWFMKHYWH